MNIIRAKTTKPFNLAIIVSRFNEEISSALHESALARLKELSFPEENITVVWVTGAIEIPIAAQRLANNVEAIICLGCVIRGETDHYNYVCNLVSTGCQTVALQNNIPVIFGVLTTDNEEQALARVGGIHGNKAYEAVDAALEMVSVLQQIN